VALRGYYLGCPGWGDKAWVGRLFPEGTRHTAFLAHYARVFNTVEGNTTFYALPTADTVKRWGDDVPDEFRFCFKFPRTVSHDRPVLDAADQAADGVKAFLDRVTPLGAKLGTLFLQLPPRFGPRQLGQLDSFLAALPRGPAYAVELRHELFFAGGHEETEAVELLRARGVDLVIMDARGLHASGSLAIADVRARKPDLPVIMRATGSRPLVRCVPHDSFEEGRRFVEPWVAQVARWITEGKQPYFFMHSPDDTYAPENAYKFHAMLRAVIEVGELPPWPGAPRQLGLF
jgi:uncharacterized protein YecE (DUF72 family)